MYVQRFLMTSIVAATGFFISACATGPDAPMASGSYQCGQLDVRIASAGDGDLLGVDYQGKRLLLKPKVSASGALYVAPGDDEASFWSKGKSRVDRAPRRAGADNHDRRGNHGVSVNGKQGQPVTGHNFTESP